MKRPEQLAAQLGHNGTDQQVGAGQRSGAAATGATAQSARNVAASDTSACPRCGLVTDLGACSSGACRNCGFRPSCSMG